MNSSGFFSKRRKDRIFEILKPYFDALEREGIYFQNIDYLAIYNGLDQLHAEYNNVFKISQTRVDRYKILIWAPYVIIDKVAILNNQREMVLETAIELTEKQLGIEKVKFPSSLLDILTAKSTNHLNKDPISIDRLGLYTAIKTANEVTPPYPYLKPIGKLTYRVGKWWSSGS